MTAKQKEQVIQELLNDEECKKELIRDWNNDFEGILFYFGPYQVNPTDSRAFKSCLYEFAQKYLKAVMSLSARKSIYLSLLELTKDDAIDRRLGTPDKIADDVYNEYLPSYFEYEKKMWPYAKSMEAIDPFKWVKKFIEENESDERIAIQLRMMLERWTWHSKYDDGIKMAIIKQFMKSDRYEDFKEELMSGELYKQYPVDNKEEEETVNESRKRVRLSESQLYNYIYKRVLNEMMD